MAATANLITRSYGFNLSPEGPLTARIACVCEKPAADEVRENRILVGPSGTRVRNHFARAGLHAGNNKELSHDVFLTNAVQSFDNPRANPTTADVIRELPRLYKELAALPNLTTIVGMGAVALMALSNLQYGDITNRRGSRLRTPFGTKFIPTFHPAYYMRDEWRFAPVVQFDVARAIEELAWPEIRLTPRDYRIRPTSLEQALGWFAHLRESASKTGYLSFDIETFQGKFTSWYISCLAFSTTPTEAYCIPITYRDRSPYWPNLSDEAAIWREISSVLNIPKVCYVTQNGCAFDAPQLRKHGIALDFMGDGFDTFSAHSLLAPDLPHSLAFIVSIYTDEPYYKDESGRGEAGFGRVEEDIFWTYNCKDAALTLQCAFGIMHDLKEH